MTDNNTVYGTTPDTETPANELLIERPRSETRKALELAKAGDMAAFRLAAARKDYPCAVRHASENPPIQFNRMICKNMPFQPGNQEARKAKKAKPFRDALRLEMAAAEQGQPCPAPKGSLRWNALVSS
jgi:hypothetical protein